MLHFLLEIIIMTRSTRTRLLLRDKCKVVHSDCLYRSHYIAKVLFHYTCRGHGRGVCQGVVDNVRNIMFDTNIIILDRLFNTWHWCVCVNCKHCCNLCVRQRMRVVPYT